MNAAPLFGGLRLDQEQRAAARPPSRDWPSSGDGLRLRLPLEGGRTPTVEMWRCGGRTPATPTHPAPARQRMQGSAIMAVCDAFKQATITHRICAERAGGTGCCRCAGGGRCAAVRAACGLGTVGGGVNAGVGVVEENTTNPVHNKPCAAAVAERSYRRFHGATPALPPHPGASA